MDGIERIKILSSEIKDDALLSIIDYLLSRKDMNDKYLNEEKNLKQMIDFIMSEAQKKAKANRAIVKDEVVFGWAIHYWDESNENLKIEDVITKDSAPNIKTSKEKKKKNNNDNWQPEGQLTLFDVM